MAGYVRVGKNYRIGRQIWRRIVQHRPRAVNETDVQVQTGPVTGERQIMHKRLLYRQEDRNMLRRLAIWVECMMMIIGTILLGILLLS